ncbi:MAG: hypothetical protein NVS1B2_16370 [Vulcanimicrobiaceae bacterium]
MPDVATGSKPSFSTDTVYVSGASEAKLKCPLSSVAVVVDCEGLVALTFAFATGAFVDGSTTEPFKLPVVPARTKVPWRSKTRETKTTTSVCMKRHFSMLSP